MATPSLRSALVLGVAALIALISLFVPWWTLSGTVSGTGFGTVTSSASAAPFNDAQGSVNGTTLTGVFWCIGLALALGALITALIPQRLPGWLPGTLGGVAGLLFLLMPLLAITTWPPSGAQFWGNGGASTATFSTYANVGWYMALVAGLTTFVGAGLAFVATRPAAETAPAPTQA